jgi:hypothetical protein
VPPLDVALTWWKTALVAAPGQGLEAVVRDELRPYVEAIVHRLVPELVAETLNGFAPAAEKVPGGHELRQEATSGSRAADPLGAADAPTTKTCSRCGRSLPLDRFAPGRRQCRSCRNAQALKRERARRREAVPFPGSQPTDSPAGTPATSSASSSPTS